MQILDIQQLSIAYGERNIINNLTFQLAAQQCLCLQGQIGSGKSTLLHCLLGFVPFQQGQIRLFGQSCKNEKDFVPLRGKIGLCFQQPDDQLFGPTVLDDVAFGPLNQGLSQSQAYAIAQQQLEKLAILHLKDRPIHQLSGGEKNFTALAGVLAMQPQLLLLDEPTNGLDQKTQKKMTALLRELNLAMLIATHDLAFSAEMADEVLYLDR